MSTMSSRTGRRTAPGGPPAGDAGGDRRCRVRRTGRGAWAAGRAGRRPAHRRQQLPHVPAAALPGRDSRSGRRERLVRRARHPAPAAPVAAGRRRHGPASAWRASSASTSTAGTSTSTTASRRPVRRAGRRAPEPSRTTTARRACTSTPSRSSTSTTRSRLRAHVLGCFERAADEPAARSPSGAIDAVVCGGGPTGVEMAGGLHELYHDGAGQGLPRPARRRRPHRRRGDGRPAAGAVHAHVLGAGPADARAPGRRGRPRRRRVRRRGGPGPRSPTAPRSRAGTVVWATGVTAEPLAAHDRHTDRAGRPSRRRARPVAAGPPRGVRRSATSRRTRSGDDAAAAGRPAGDPGRPARRPADPQPAGRAADGVVPVPRQGPDGDDRPPRRRHRAGQRLALRGTIGWLSWLGLHLVYLIGFRNRVVVLVNWAWSYLTYDRGSRILREGERRHDEHRRRRRRTDGAIPTAAGQT